VTGRPWFSPLPQEFHTVRKVIILRTVDPKTPYFIEQNQVQTRDEARRIAANIAK
jgi:hypothetical protein